MDTVNKHKIKPSLARDRLLSTAHDLFYREGIRATGIDRLIKQAGVTKVTFYRHFISKNALIIAYLEYRHQRWMTWFIETMNRYDNKPEALIDTLSEWFNEEHYRGCAFINSVGELGGVLPEVTTITICHKQEMTTFIMQLLPVSKQRKKKAEAIALAIDGAIIRAQYDQSPKIALQGLRIILKAILD
jgi:AcrR family transcriptional regulator